MKAASAACKARVWWTSIQLECISQSSTVLRITNGPFTGRIWVNTGDVVDAETEELRGEDAFHMILRWKAGNFEFLPAEPHRPRTISNPTTRCCWKPPRPLMKTTLNRAVTPARPFQSHNAIKI
jgi:hypothetical protein